MKYLSCSSASADGGTFALVHRTQFFDSPSGCVAGLTLPLAHAILFSPQHELGLVEALGLESSFEG